MCPLAARLVNGPGHGLGRGRMVAHCLLVETDRDGLVLVDSGFGTHDIDDPGRFHRGFLALTAPRFDRRETAIEQVRALGRDPKDVRHVVVTHLDLDHAGGLADFPWAQVHLHRVELHAGTTRASRQERLRYVAEQWAHGPRWEPYDEEGDEWFGLSAIRKLRGLEADIALVPLFGHSRGHSGVAVRDGAGWLLHAGDAYFFHGEVEATPHCPAGLDLFQRIVQQDGRARRRNAARLRELNARHAKEVTVFSAHDPVELERLRARPRPATVAA